MKKTIVALGLVVLSSLAWALPSVQDVEAAAKAGRFTEAETMMAEVVTAKPGSAKAHYTYAELLAHNGNFAKASGEAARAREIDPKITFADPDKFRSFEDLLGRARNPAPRAAVGSSSVAERPSGSTAAPVQRAVPAPASTGIPGWIWLAGLAVLAVFVWRMFSRRGAPGAFNAGGPANGFGGAPMGNPGGFPGQGGGGVPGQGYGTPGQGYGPQQGRAGGGMLGTGMAVAGGVAGGMLLDQMLNRHAEAGTHNATGNNVGGLDAGSYDPGSAGAANELENRSVDFGSGDSWDSGGGSMDSGGDVGGDSGGGWD